MLIYFLSTATNHLERWSSWFKAPVLKIGVRASVPWVRIPPSPPFFLWRHTQAGRRGQFAKLLGFVRAARVRISLSPPEKTTLGCLFFCFFWTRGRGFLDSGEVRLGDVHKKSKDFSYLETLIK